MKESPPVKWLANFISLLLGTSGTANHSVGNRLPHQITPLMYLTCTKCGTWCKLVHDRLPLCISQTMYSDSCLKSRDFLLTLNQIIWLAFSTYWGFSWCSRISLQVDRSRQVARMKGLISAQVHRSVQRPDFQNRWVWIATSKEISFRHQNEEWSVSSGDTISREWNKTCGNKDWWQKALDSLLTLQRAAIHNVKQTL